MTRDQFLDAQFKASVAAGMNQRYHQRRADCWERRDRWTKIAMGALAVAGLCLAVATIGEVHWGLVAFDLAIAILGAIAGVALNVIPLGEWRSEHRALFQRWTDLREDLDSLLYDVGDAPTDALILRLRELEAKHHRICGNEPDCDDSLLHKCYDIEVKSRQPEAVAC